MGWLTTEELWWDAEGRLRTHAPSTYKIPACGDRPRVFNVKLLEDSPNREETIYRSKAVGEPPLMLAISVLHALSDAVASVARSEEHTSELQSLMRISYAVFCLKKKNQTNERAIITTTPTPNI